MESKTIEVITEDNESVKNAVMESSGILAAAESYVIDSREMYDLASTELGMIRKAEKRIEDERTKITGPMNAALKATNAFFKKPADILERAKKTLAAKMLAYENAQLAIRKEEERRATEARRAAEAEAARKLAEAANELAAGAPGAEEKLEEAHIEAMTAAVSAPVAVESALDRGGHAKRVTWSATVTNLPLLLRHIADSLERGEETFNNTVDIKAGQLNKFADSTKGAVTLPGVAFSKTETIIARAG